MGKIRIDSIIHLSFVLCLVFLLLGCRKKVEGKLVGFFIVTILNFVLKGGGEEKKWIRLNSMDVLATNDYCMYIFVIKEI